MEPYNAKEESQQILRDLLRLARETYVKSLGGKANAVEKEISDMYEEVTTKRAQGEALTVIEQKFLQWIEEESGEEFEFIQGCRHETLETILNRGWF